MKNTVLTRLSVTTATSSIPFTPSVIGIARIARAAENCLNTKGQLTMDKELADELIRMEAKMDRAIEMYKEMFRDVMKVNDKTPGEITNIILGYEVKIFESIEAKRDALAFMFFQAAIIGRTVAIKSLVNEISLEKE